jgi:hypothetical protein
VNQRSEIGVCSCQDIVGIKTPIEGTPNPDIEPGICILQVQVLEISHLWEINPIFLKITIVGVLQSGIRAWLQHSA